MPFARTLILAIAGLAATTLPSVVTPASATPIVAGSQIDVSGGLVPIGSANIDTATGLDFLYDGVSGTPTGTITLTNSPTGSFAADFNVAGCPYAATAGGCGVIKDIQSFSTFSMLTDFYTVTEGANTLHFDLSTLFVESRVPGTATSLPALTISGTGIFRLSGYDDTPGIFTLTTQGPGTVSFSASTVAQLVGIAEPSSLALLGAGLAGAAIVARQRGRRQPTA